MFPVTDPILVFTILVFGILIAPIFSARLRIPDLVILLAFGALLGPHGLNVLERNTAVTLLGSVGLLYIMFLAGIEIDLQRFSQSYKRSLGFGILTFILPQTLGALAGRFVLDMSWPAAILLASMFASHTLLAYPLASRLGISRSEPVTITVGATIITDILALLVLAVVADSARGIPLNPAFWATLAIGMLLLTLLIWKGVPIASRWFFHRVTEESNAQFLFVLVIVCGCAYLSHFAKMEPIIGAFMVGAAFNRLIPENSPLMNRVTFAGNTLFIPFFLISVGMLVDMRVLLTGARSWMVGATMVVMVIVTKFMAAQAARRAYGYSPDAGRVMFGLSVVQAAATLAAVMIGYELKIFGDSVLNGTIVMIVVTCALGSWVVDRYGRRMAAETPTLPESARNEQRLMITVANPTTVTPLLDLAFALRKPTRPGGIYPLTIIRDQGNTDEAVVKGENLLGQCLAHAASADMPVNPELRVSMNVSDGIVHAARELRATSAIMGWTSDNSASIRIFGTVAQRMVERCPSRLLFCRLVSPLNTTVRLLLPLPPLAQKRRDISTLVNDAKMLAQRIGAELQPYMREDDAKDLQPLIENSKPDCRMNFITAKDWVSLRQKLFADIAANDTMLLPVDRRSGVLWSPALEHLPEVVVEQFPNLNLLVDYPSLPELDLRFRDPANEQSEGESTFPTLLPVDLYEGNTLEHALQKLVEKTFPGNPSEAKAALDHLLDSARSYPVELAPGMVLLHARCGDLATPMLMVCHAADGWPVTDLPTPAKIILVLLGSGTKPPEEHLKTLSHVANRLFKASQKPEFQAARNAEDICKAFECSEHIQKPQIPTTTP